jgi:hypothetical protein
MTSRRFVIALVLVQLVAFAVSAQQSAELGRASGGEIMLTSKRSSGWSGSVEASLMNGSPGYGSTAGGTLIQDRLWFFASASRQASALGARVNGYLGSRHDFAASFETARRPQLSTTFAAGIPASFLSLRYTGIISSSMFFNASMTRSSHTAPAFGITPQ